jgi:hypothetical protein
VGSAYVAKALIEQYGTCKRHSLKVSLPATSHPAQFAIAATSLAKNLNLDIPVMLARRHIHRQVIQMINQLLKILRLDLR